jgi:ankyrin repeat protein
LLLAQGADPNAVDKHNQTPLHRAVDQGGPDSKDTARRCDCDIAQLLLDGGADVNGNGDLSCAALHTAARDGHLEAAARWTDVAI